MNFQSRREFKFVQMKGHSWLFHDGACPLLRRDITENTFNNRHDILSSSLHQFKQNSHKTSMGKGVERSLRMWEIGVRDTVRPKSLKQVLTAPLSGGL